jgi:hypothetical protein
MLRVSAKRSLPTPTAAGGVSGLLWRAALAPVQPPERDSAMLICRKRLRGFRIGGLCCAKRLPLHTGDGPSSRQPEGAISRTKDPTERIE